MVKNKVKERTLGELWMSGSRSYPSSQGVMRGAVQGYRYTYLNLCLSTSSAQEPAAVRIGLVLAARMPDTEMVLAVVVAAAGYRTLDCWQTPLRRCYG